MVRSYHHRSSLALLLPYAAFIVSAISLMLTRDFTPDNELRYLSIADEALAQGQIFAFTNHGLPYADKPPLYIWIVMACRMIFGKHMMIAIGAFSLIPALLTGVVMDKWTRKMLDPKMRIAALWMLFSTAYFFGLSVTLRMDMLMTLFIVLALYSFCKYYSDPDKEVKQRVLFPLWLFLAVFSKGPLGLLIPLLGSVLFLIMEKKLKQFGRLWGWRTWTILLVLCGIWFGGVWLDGGNEYLNNLLVHQTVGRAVNAFHHQRPFYYYAIAIWYVAAPWSLLIAGAIVRHIGGATKWSATEKMLGAASMCTFVMLSAISSKVQVYLLPMLPLIVYLAAIGMCRNGVSLFEKWMVLLPLIAICLPLPAFLVLWYGDIPQLESIKSMAINMGINAQSGWPFLAAGATISFGAVIALCFLFRKGKIATAISWMGAGIILGAGLCGVGLETINPYIGYKALATQAEAMASEGATIFTWKVRRAENIDVFLCKNRKLQILREDSIPSDSIKPAAGDIIIVPTASASDLHISNATGTTRGQFSIFKINRITTPTSDNEE